MISEPGALVLEDGRYDITVSLDGLAYATAWVEFPPGDRTLQLEMAIVGEDGSIVLAPQVVEILPMLVDWVKIVTGGDGYLILYGMGNETVLIAVDAAGQ